MKKTVIGMLAHVDSGKTTLSEAMLYLSGAINKLGRVDKKDSFFDTFSLERSRGITIFSKQAVFEYNNTQFTLLDTPGHIDFSAETERTLQVLDYAVLVVSAADGVQSHTLTLWRLLKKYGVACFVFVNKTDLDTADKALVLRRLKEKFGDGCIDFSDTKSEAFFENAALCDEALLNKYYETGTLEENDISECIKRRKIFPCMFGSALKLDGVEAFLNILEKYTLPPKYKTEFSAKVFKIAENKGTRLTFLKITGGSLRVREALQSQKNKTGEKVNQIRIYSGEKFVTADEAEAGTVCAVTGITFAKPGDGLGAESDSAMPVLEPVLTYRTELPDGIDAHKALEKMKILEDEDPQLKVVWNDRLKEIHLQLMGGVQLEVLQCIIKERFGLEVKFGKGGIIYKETIADTVEGIGHFEPLRHYAEVHLILKPGKRDSGIIVRSQCKEDVLDKNWQRLIITHLCEKTHLGVLTGSPITDVEITLASGRAHPKHTEGGDFRQATYRAVRQGLRSAKSVLLEPIYEFFLEVPSESIGRAMADIQRMSGSFDPPETNADASTLHGFAPVGEMLDYSQAVVQYTHGKGKLTCLLKGYDVCHDAQKVIEEIGYDCDADTDNPCDSVFCSHGAGFNVKWDEVKSRMHLPCALSVPKSEYTAQKNKKAAASKKDGDSLFALDKELMRIFEQTYGPIKSRNYNRYQGGFTLTESSDKGDNEKNENQKKYKEKKPKYGNETEYLLVDGYNVIFSWDSLKKNADESIEAARNTLINILCNFQGYKKCEIILVFDAYKVKNNPGEVERVNNISIVYTKEAETADTYIEKTSHRLAKNNRVRVVTSDALEQLIILEGGALRVSSREFQFEVAQAEEEIRKIIEKNK